MKLHTFESGLSRYYIVQKQLHEKTGLFLSIESVFYIVY